MSVYREAPLVEEPRKTWWQRMVEACRSERKAAAPRPEGGEFIAELRALSVEAERKRLESAWRNFSDAAKHAVSKGDTYALLYKRDYDPIAQRLADEGFAIENPNGAIVTVRW